MAENKPDQTPGAQPGQPQNPDQAEEERRRLQEQQDADNASKSAA